MNTETPQTTPETPSLTPEEITAKFDNQERQFVEVENNHKALREFFVKYHDAIAQFSWSRYGINKTVTFNCAYGDNKDKQKDIARSFGAAGWKRVKNEYACGRIDWKKEVDGILIEIDCAEQINPKLIEEVKL